MNKVFVVTVFGLAFLGQVAIARSIQCVVGYKVNARPSQGWIDLSHDVNGLPKNFMLFRDTSHFDLPLEVRFEPAELNAPKNIVGKHFIRVMAGLPKSNSVLDSSLSDFVSGEDAGQVRLEQFYNRQNDYIAAASMIIQTDIANHAVLQILIPDRVLQRITISCSVE